jgi:hypothetical protein
MKPGRSSNAHYCSPCGDSLVSPELKDYEIAGAEWITNEERFEIIANALSGGRTGVRRHVVSP